MTRHPAGFRLLLLVEAVKDTAVLVLGDASAPVLERWAHPSEEVHGSSVGLEKLSDVDFMDIYLPRFFGSVMGFVQGDGVMADE